MLLVALTPTNEALKSLLGVEMLTQLVWERLRALSTGRLHETAEQLVRHACVDPVRVFVQSELHSAEKAAQGRYRLIMSISLVDQLVERTLNSGQNRAEILQHETLPSKPGMGLHDDGLQELSDALAGFESPVESDMTGYDWSVSWWMLNADVECRIALSALPAHSVYATILRSRVWALANSMLVFSNGDAYVQTTPGVQKSGSYNTSSTNSRIRVLLALLVGSERAIAMGDDAVEEYAEGALEKYRELGMAPKMYQRVSLDSEQGIEFCATRFSNAGPGRPVRWQRMFATLLQKTPQSVEEEEELVCAFSHDLRHSPYRTHCLDLLSRVSWGYPGKPC